MSGFLLPDGCAIDSQPMWGNVLDLEADHVTASEFAVDGEIKQREVALSAADLQIGPARPDVLRS
jgi:hypothetical protein